MQTDSARIRSSRDALGALPRRPAWRPLFRAGKGLPVLTYGSEDVDDHRSLRPDNCVVKDVARDPVGPASPQRLALSADPERNRALDDHADLLVLMPVLREDGVRFQLDEPQGQPLAVHDAAGDPVPDLLGRRRG